MLNSMQKICAVVRSETSCRFICSQWLQKIVWLQYGCNMAAFFLLLSTYFYHPWVS